MSKGQNQRGRLREVTNYLGLTAPDEPRPRSRWARVTAAGEDSSRQEAAAGLLLAVLLLLLVATRLFGQPLWFRPVAAVAVVLLLLSVVRGNLTAVSLSRVPLSASARVTGLPALLIIFVVLAL